MKKRFFKRHKEATIVSDDVMKHGILIGAIMVLQILKLNTCLK